MRELNNTDIEQVSGGTIWIDTWKDIRQIIKELPDAYRDAIGSVTDMMCTATGNC